MSVSRWISREIQHNQLDSLKENKNPKAEQNMEKDGAFDTDSVKIRVLGGESKHRPKK